MNQTRRIIANWFSPRMDLWAFGSIRLESNHREIVVLLWSTKRKWFEWCHFSEHNDKRYRKCHHIGPDAFAYREERLKKRGKRTRSEERERIVFDIDSISSIHLPDKVFSSSSSAPSSSSSSSFSLLRSINREKKEGNEMNHSLPSSTLPLTN